MGGGLSGWGAEGGPVPARHEAKSDTGFEPGHSLAEMHRIQITQRY